jgi:hypothetical protein
MPASFSRPEFGSTFNQNRFALNEAGIEEVGRITTAIAIAYPSM